MPVLRRSARGTVVDMELLKIKQDLAKQSVQVEIDKSFIDDQKPVINPNQKSSPLPNFEVGVGDEMSEPDDFENDNEEVVVDDPELEEIKQKKGKK
jgi:hypothetical protein